MGKALHASMFGVLADQFKTNMVYPVDKPPSKRKTYDRILGFMASVFFNDTAEKIHNACAISIIEILENTFPEYLDPLKADKLQLVFFAPLLRYIQEGGNSKNVVASSAFVIKEILLHLMKNHPELVTQEMAMKLADIAIKSKVNQANYVKAIEILLDFFNQGVAAVAGGNSRHLFSYAISSIVHQTESIAKIGGRPLGNQLEDIRALLSLQ